MRSVFEPIRVETDGKGTPARLCWNGRILIVSRVIDHWRYVGKWWLFPTGQRRTYYRLEARALLERQQLAEPRIVEVFQQDGQWTISYFCD